MEWANAGNPIIIEKFNPHYSDYPYGMFPLSSTYNFNSKKFKGLDGVGKKSIIGIETPIWTEYITRFEQMSSMCFPRRFAVADAVWNGNTKKDYKKFAEDAEFYCNILKNKGYNPAPRCDWYQDLFKRLLSTLKFAYNLMTKEMLKGLIFKNKDH